ncbi:AMMECR1 family isoform X2 [Carex rostrata]
MVSANREMVVYCFDTLVAHYSGEQPAPPAFEEGQHALRDRRFPPIQAKEIPYLECTVSVLTNYEVALHHLDWEVGKHGLIIEFTDPDYNMRRNATYLPDVPAHEGWTKIETIDSLMRKAGYNGVINESLRKKLRVTRYQSTLYTMQFADYASYVKSIRGAAPAINGAPIINGFRTKANN